jgi:hypothetical protein
VTVTVVLASGGYEDGPEVEVSHVSIASDSASDQVDALVEALCVQLTIPKKDEITREGIGQWLRNSCRGESLIVGSAVLVVTAEDSDVLQGQHKEVRRLKTETRTISEYKLDPVVQDMIWAGPGEAKKRKRKR